MTQFHFSQKTASNNWSGPTHTFMAHLPSLENDPVTELCGCFFNQSLTHPHEFIAKAQHLPLEVSSRIVWESQGLTLSRGGRSHLHNGQACLPVSPKFIAPSFTPWAQALLPEGMMPEWVDPAGLPAQATHNVCPVTMPCPWLCSHLAHWQAHSNCSINANYYYIPGGSFWKYKNEILHTYFSQLAWLSIPQTFHMSAQAVSSPVPWWCLPLLYILGSELMFSLVRSV